MSIACQEENLFPGFFLTSGKKCFNCKYFYEEKRHQYPELIAGNENNGSFMDAFSDFEEWINDLQSKRVACEGKVAGISPNLSLKQQGNHQQISAHGFLVRFEEGFIDDVLFEDPFYLSISAISQNKLLLQKGDNLEFEASLIIDRGRFRFIKPGRFQFYERGDEKPLRKNDVLVALQTYTIQENQPGKCMGCAYGLLVDVDNYNNGPSRATVCLQGIADYRYCTVTVRTSDSDDGDSCINTTWKGKKCHHVL